MRTRNALRCFSTYLTGGNSFLDDQKNLWNKQQKAFGFGSNSLELETEVSSIMYGITNMGVEPKDLETEIDKLIKQVQDKYIPMRILRSFKI